MKREPIYFPASLLLFVTSALLYLIELVFIPWSLCYCVCLFGIRTLLSHWLYTSFKYTKA